MAQLKITLKKSYIGYNSKQRKTAHALGLKKIGRTVIKPDNPCTRGMVDKIVHLVEVEEIADAIT